MPETFAEKLAKDDVFSHLSTRDHEELARLAFQTSYHKGQYISMQDDTWNRALYIKSGKLGWVMLSPDGKRQVVFRMGAGRVVWGHTLFDGEPMPAALEVMEDCEVCMWEGDAIMPILSRNVDAVWAITRTLVVTMRKVPDVVYGLPWDEMAPPVGTTRELVSKTLHQFAGEGMIEISRVEITFTDRGKLEELIDE